MEISDVMHRLRELGNESRRRTYMKRGAPESTYGVAQGDLRKLAKTLEMSHNETMALWDLGIADAQFLACLKFDPNALSLEEIRSMVSEAAFVEVLDKFVNVVVVKHPNASEFIEEWTESKEDLIARAGWYLIVHFISRGKYHVAELEELLSIIEGNLQGATPQKQWAMNHALCEIGIKNPSFTKVCIDIGERLGVYRDLKVSKGCTSPYAPEWIGAVVKKQKS